jgi:hypothetical protein
MKTVCDSAPISAVPTCPANSEHQGDRVRLGSDTRGANLLNEGRST